MITKDEATRRVARGLSWLKESGEQYGFNVSKLNPQTLDISSGYDCVFGQLTGAYSWGLDRMGKLNEEGYQWAAEHGFACAPGALLTDFRRTLLEYALLTKAWREALAEERLRTAATLILAA